MTRGVCEQRDPVYEDLELWNRLAESGYRHVENHFTPPIVGQRIADALKLLGVLDPA